MTELSSRFEPPQDRPTPAEPDRPTTPERDRDARFDDYDSVIDRVAAFMEHQERPARATDVDAPQGVADRVVGPEAEADRPALEAVCDAAGRELHDKIPLDRWQAADHAGRGKLAQEAHDMIRDRYGLKPRQLEMSSALEDGVLGRFSSRTGDVAVSDDLLTDAEPYELMNTIAHENQHVAQEEIMKERMAHPLGNRGQPEVDAWREGARTYDVADFRGKGYAYNPLEVDANNAGNRVVAGYKDARMEALEARNAELEALVADQAAERDSREGPAAPSTNRNPDERPQP